MQTVILAGGKGTRLKPYTTIFPKPLMPIGEMPILEVILRQLKYYQCNEIVMAVGYLKELLQAYFNYGEKWDINIRYSVEEKTLGTAAPLKLVNDLQDNFMVMNGDVLTNINYADFFHYHQVQDSLCTIAVYKKQVKIDLGVLDLDQQNVLTSYTEKPTIDYNVSMGVYAFNKAVLDYIPQDSYFDFPDLVKSLIKDGKKVMAYPFDGYWLDIGRPEDYQQAAEVFEENISEFLK
ncbi:MAG: NTP transferase domain-containing protein [Calditrichae bacterium]|nr:NTP transferase domain-containing protein [Calditrichota bacterium]MCB9059585.1 NTP transferase domain-containing protein [Calditrichia bacterium]